ncbi:hypothetical protein BDV18DRAFT_136279 [Aspergillus unguis]
MVGDHMRIPAVVCFLLTSFLAVYLLFVSDGSNQLVPDRWGESSSVRALLRNLACMMYFAKRVRLHTRSTRHRDE